MQVLVVEDDQALGSLLKKGLETEGYRVEWVADGEAALTAISAGDPDLLVLDLSLPRRDGVEVLRELKGLRRTPSVLVLTGRCDVQARVECLDLGADDCLLKPFSFRELTARCRALVRRRTQFADPVLRRGDLMLDRIERSASLAGNELVLTPKEFGLLEYLLLHPGECVSREELLAAVWKTEEPTGTNVVDVYVNYLRRKLDPRPDLIETVRGVGYRVGGTGREDLRSELKQSSGTPLPAYA